jgi:predicted phage terminase large subunit-like protein
MVAQPLDRRYGELLDLDAIRTELAERHLRHFVKQAWHIVEPSTEYKHNWHIDALCDHLEATLPQVVGDARTSGPGAIRDLLVTMPPRAMKSLIISVFFPAWVWIDHPEIRFLYASYAQMLATDHSQLTRMVIESDWYQARWGDRFQLADDDNLKTRFSNTARGQRIATSVGSAVTGFGGDYVICDDPHNVQQVESESVRESAVRWWNKSMSTRRNNPATSVRIVVMQRVHESDVAGSCIATGEYTHLNLPQEYEETSYVSPIGWTDPRKREGELLWPERMTPAYVASQKKDLGSTDYAAQHQQRPSPAEGGMFKKHWWRYWQPRGDNLPPVEVKMPDGSVRHVYAEEQPAWWYSSAQSWDMTFKETKTGSYVVGLVGAVHGPNGFLLDLCRDRMEFTEAVKAVRKMTNDHPTVGAKLIEDKANGPAVISELQGSIAGIIPVPVDGSKEARAASATPRVEAGNWYLPHPDLPGAEWVPAFIHELASFPTGAHDDQVDAFSQLDRYLMSWAANDESDDVIDEMNRELGG